MSGQEPSSGPGGAGDAAKIAAAAALPVNDNLMLEVGMFPVPADGGEDARLLLVVDANSQFVMGTNVIASSPDEESACAAAVDAGLLLSWKARKT